MGNRNSTQKLLANVNVVKEQQQPYICVEKEKEKEKEEVNLIYDDDKDLKFYFNAENNIHRQHNHHFLKKHLFKCNVSSPVNERLIKGGKLLDLGCGPATFLLDVAAQYPNTECFGIDIEPVFPQEGLPYPDNEFDLVHMETILFSITREQLNFIIREMIRVTKPNGYIEFVETHMTCRSKGVGKKFGQLLRGFELVTNSYGGDSDLVLSVPELLTKNSNINNLNIQHKNLVLGKNGGKLGKIIEDIFGWFDNSSESFVNDCCKVLKITKDQYNQLVVDTFKEVNHTFPEVGFYRIYARKKDLIINSS